jgi:hypothetical protein
MDPTAKDKSTYIVPETSIFGPIGTAVAFQGVIALNAATFQNPDKVTSSGNSYIYQKTFIAGETVAYNGYAFEIKGSIGDIRDGGGLTLTNTFIILKDCITPRTSYPGTKGD